MRPRSPKEQRGDGEGERGEICGRGEWGDGEPENRDLWRQEAEREK